MKTCSRCGETKPLTDFRKGKGYADGYRGQCKACLSELKREYKQRPEVKEHIREQQREYESRPEIQEARRVRQREYTKRPEVKKRTRAYFHRPDVNERVNERERNRWRNDEKLREYKRTYLRERFHNNPDHRRKQMQHSMAALHRRRAKLKLNGGSYTAQQWRDLQAKYGHKCLRCGEVKPLTPDHIVPVDSGGTGDISNIQPLCLPCNLWKATKTIDFRPDA